MRSVRLMGFCLWLCLCLSACRQTDSLPDSDQAAIFAVVIRQLVTVDDTYGGTLHPSLIYVLTTTNDQVGDPDTPSGDPQSLTPKLQNNIVAALTDLTVTIIWVESREDVPIDASTGQIAEKGVLVTLGNIQPQTDGTVQVPASIYIANLAAGGQTYVLEQVEGVWMIMGNTGVEWIS